MTRVFYKLSPMHDGENAPIRMYLFKKEDDNPTVHCYASGNLRTVNQDASQALFEMLQGIMTAIDRGEVPQDVVEVPTPPVGMR